jgi:hypothetical protein
MGVKAQLRELGQEDRHSSQEYDMNDDQEIEELACSDNVIG